MKVLIDSDALFALYVASDSLHSRAKTIFKKLLDLKTELLFTNLVIQETATVLSYRFGQKQARDFLIRIRKIDMREIFVGQTAINEAWRIFTKQTKKGTSFIDCANLVIAKELGVNKIFSFDGFYKEYRILG